MPDEQERKQNLADARQEDRQKAENKKPEKKSTPAKSPQKKLLNNLKKASATAKAMLFSIEMRDIFFIGAIMMAVLKDISDFPGMGSIPVIGTVLTLMASITIIAGMLVSGSYKSGRKNKSNVKRAIKRWGTLAGGTLTELLFGVNFLPVETLTALITFGLMLLERAELKKEEAENNAESDN
jgi:hypothetical protein